MEQDSDSSSQAEIGVNRVAGGNYDAVGKIMDSVANKIHGGNRRFNFFAVKVMAMVPADEFFKSKKREYPEKD